MRAEAGGATALASDDPHAPYAFRGLTYPFGHRAPDPGEILPIADGVGWARLPVPGALKHINIWLLDDGDGVAIVDTGLDIPACREGLNALLDRPLAGRHASRIICTHFHPDHLGGAGRLCDRFDAPLWMTRGEWLFARMLTSDVRDSAPPRGTAAVAIVGMG